ncbi:hypothetical protein EVAR_7802_1 [Eumeta japonica]|uniref:Uncharacterized protein n=1 Tax=Eumeta variegata TaxID=151549 RepID=A0A4C1TJ67_EUMVA|nr:hypothetical protein EVAR_7802_1 [Eumeta japonica]
MLLSFLPIILFALRARAEESRVARVQYSFPIPLDLPTRNERAQQCYIRIEDADLTETLSIYCHLAHTFLRYHVRDYNVKKQTMDGVEVTPWAEESSQGQDTDLEQEIADASAQKNSKDWKLTTVLDPITRMRLYVTKNADCHVIMYNREATTNYRVNCDKILYFVNSNYANAAKRDATSGIITGISFLVLAVMDY